MIIGLKSFRKKFFYFRLWEVDDTINNEEEIIKKKENFQTKHCFNK